jgi:hypothetical protein
MSVSIEMNDNIEILKEETHIVERYSFGSQDNVLLIVRFVV